MENRLGFADYTRHFQKTAYALLQAAQTPIDVAGSMHLLTVAVERDLQRFGTASELEKVACFAGCNSCCILNVAVLFPEAIAINRYLWHKLDYDQLVLLHDRLEELHIRTRWMTDEERIFLREPCAFLTEEGTCLIHCVRPLICRSITSLNPAVCKNVLDMAPFSEQQTVPMNLFQKNLMDAAFTGFGEALQQLSLDASTWRLTAAVFRVMSMPGAVDDFLVGKKIPQY